MLMRARFSPRALSVKLGLQIVRIIDMMNEDRVDVVQSFNYHTFNIRCHMTWTISKKATAEASLPAGLEEGPATYQSSTTASRWGALAALQRTEKISKLLKASLSSPHSTRRVSGRVRDPTHLRPCFSTLLSSGKRYRTQQRLKKWWCCWTLCHPP